MRRAISHLACFAVAATGCLQQHSASLTGLTRVGYADAGDAGIEPSDGGDGGPAASDGGDGGASASDGGDAGDAGLSVCPWRDAGEAGNCTDDSQCQPGFYCDFTVNACLDGLSTLNPGICLLACPVTASFTNGPGAVCTVNEDCAPSEICTCAEPCGDVLNCYMPYGDLLCSAPLPLPPGCYSITVPHSPQEACVCADNTCSPDGGDGGTYNQGGCDDDSCPAEMTCTPPFPRYCCINTDSYLNRCQQDSDCCPIVVNGVSEPVVCKDTVCQNDWLGQYCNKDSDCSPGNVCVNNACLVVAGAIICTQDSDCESSYCDGGICSCYPNDQPPGASVVNNASCCSGDDSSGTCVANTQGQPCPATSCGPGEICGSGGTCCIPSTSREQATSAANCCDGTFNPMTSECCSALPQVACTSNNDCCQGLTCDLDLPSPVCLFVANNPLPNNGSCRPNNDPSDCLPGLTCESNGVSAVCY